MSDSIASEVRQIIRAQLNHLGPMPNEMMRDDSDLVMDLGADSLDIEMILCDCAEHYDFDFTDDQAKLIKTVGDTILMVRTLSGEEG